MATQITSGAVTIVPTLVTNISTVRQGRTIVHDILGRPDPDITLRPAGLRAGTLTLLFADELASAAAETAHAGTRVFTIQSDERATLQFSYVTVGRVERALDDETRGMWVVTVEYQEVPA